MTIRAIIFFLFFSLAASDIAQAAHLHKYSVLVIEYIGLSDKPVAPIIISSSKEGAAWYRGIIRNENTSNLVTVHVVSASLFETLAADVDAVESGDAQNSGSTAKIIAVTVITPDNSHKFQFGKDSAFSIMQHLQKDCEKSDSLQSDLRHFEDRMRVFN